MLQRPNPGTPQHVGVRRRPRRRARVRATPSEAVVTQVSEVAPCDAEVACWAGLTERRYGNYVAGIREPNLGTLVSIALSTTPNHLLGVETSEVPRPERDCCRAQVVGAIDRLSGDDLERVMVQVEALSRLRGKSRRT
jgi:hypothetical protein